MNKIYRALEDFPIDHERFISSRNISIWLNSNIIVDCYFIRDNEKSRRYDGSVGLRHWLTSGTFVLTFSDIYINTELMRTRDATCIISQFTDLLIKKKL